MKNSDVAEIKSGLQQILNTAETINHELTSFCLELILIRMQDELKKKGNLVILQGGNHV